MPPKNIYEIIKERMKMQKIIKSLSKDDFFTFDSKKIEIHSNKFYSVDTIVKGILGLPYSGYFAVIMLDSNDREIERKIKWIKDFSGKNKKYQIKFYPKSKTKSVILSYRFNIETPIRSALKVELTDPSSIPLSFSSDKKEKFDKITE